MTKCTYCQETLEQADAMFTVFSEKGEIFCDADCESYHDEKMAEAKSYDDAYWSSFL